MGDFEKISVDELMDRADKDPLIQAIIQHRIVLLNYVFSRIPGRSKGFVIMKKGTVKMTTKKKKWVKPTKKTLYGLIEESIGWLESAREALGPDSMDYDSDDYYSAGCFINTLREAVGMGQIDNQLPKGDDDEE